MTKTMHLSSIPPEQGESRRTRRLDRRYLSLVLYKTYADLRAESERTYVGFLWWIVEPVLSMIVYFVVFDILLDRGTDNYVLFLFIGLIPWRWVQTSATHGASSILAERSLMQQVYVPKVVFPVVSVLADTFKFLVVFAFLILFAVLWHQEIPLTLTALPLVILVQALLVTALALLLAAVTPIVPDLRVVLENVLRLWFFLSGIFYSVEQLPERFHFYLRLNPMTVVLEAYRDILLHGRWPDLGLLSVWGLVCGVGCWLAYRLIDRLDYLYPKLWL